MKKVEKYVDNKGNEIHRELHSLSDIIPPTPEEFKKGLAKVILHGKSDLEKQSLKEHFNPVKNKPVKKKQLTFEELFRDPANAKLVKNILESTGYTTNGKWQGLSGKKQELLCAYYVLKPLLKTGLNDTPSAKIFYKEFGFDGSISERMLRNEPYNETRSEFERIFSDLLKPKK